MILLNSLFLRLGYLPTSKAVLGLPSQSHFSPIPKVNTTNASPQHNAHSGETNKYLKNNFNTVQSRDTCQCVSNKNKIIVLGNYGNLHQFLNPKIRFFKT